MGSKASGCLGTGIGLGFMLVWSLGTLAFDGMILYITWQQVHSTSYASVSGTVISSQLIVESDSEGNSYKPEVNYTYTVNGQVHKNSKYSYVNSFSSQSSSTKIVSAHPAGSAVTIYYDPKNPHEAVLYNQIDGMPLFLLLFMTPFNIFMLVMLWFGVVQRHKKNTMGGAAVLQANPNVLSYNTGNSSGLRVRMPTATPLAYAVATGGILAFLLIFVIAFGVGMPPSLSLMLCVWGGLLGVSFLMYQQRVAKENLGREHLWIDLNTVRLPASKLLQRSEPLPVPRKEVTGVEVERIPSKDSDVSDNFAAVLKWNSSGSVQSGKIYEFTNEEDATLFSAWLREKLALK